MHRATFVLLVALPFQAGCLNAALRQQTVEQVSTLTQLQYQMVLDNLAALAANPGMMPWHANITGGTTQLTDSGQGTLGASVGFYARPRNAFSTFLPALNASRTVVQQWGHDPVTDGDELRLLRIAYRRALGFDEMPSDDLRRSLAREIKKQIVVNDDVRAESSFFFREKYRTDNRSFSAIDKDTDSTVGDKKFFDPTDDPALAARRTPLAREVVAELKEITDELKDIQPGWYHVGRKHDVPKNACYVAHYHDTYVWVYPDGVEGLTNFTLSVLEMASAIHPAPALSNGAAGIMYSPGFDVSF